MSRLTHQPRLELDVEDTIKVWPQRRDRWLYISVANEYTRRIDAIFRSDPRGFRSVHVTASIGRDRWESALFRYEDGTWALPLKTSIRRRHDMEEGAIVRVHLDIMAPPTDGASDSASDSAIDRSNER